jgi:integrase
VRLWLFVHVYLSLGHMWVKMAIDDVVRTPQISAIRTPQKPPRAVSTKPIKITRTFLDGIPKPASATYYFDAGLTGFGVRVSPQGVCTYIAQGRSRGKKVRKTIGRYPLMSPEAARNIARAYLTEVHAAGKSKAIKRVRASIALDQWIAEHGPKLGQRTRDDYIKIIEKQLRPALGQRIVEDIERDDLAKMHQDRGATPRRANYELAVARAFFNWAEGAQLRPPGANPTKRIKAYAENKRERFLSEAEVAAVARALEVTSKAGHIGLFAVAALRLLMLSGARRGEVTTLRWAEIDFQRRCIFLTKSKTGRKPVFLSQPALDLLNGLPRVKDNPYVFVGNVPGEHYRDLHRAWGKVRIEAGLREVRLHDLRHSFASYGAAAGLSLPMLGALLGHSVPATTARYAHLAAHPIAEANERIGEHIAGMMAPPPSAFAKRMKVRNRSKAAGTHET